MLTPLTVRTRLMLLVLVTAVPLIGSAVALVIRHAQAERDLLLGQASKTAAAVMQSVDRELSGVVTGLEVLAASPALQREDFQAFHSLASTAVGIAGNSVIILYERSGRRVVSTAVPYGETLPSRKDMSALDAPFDTGRPHVTPLFISETVKKPTLGVIVPVKIGGEVRYVLGAGLLSDALTSVLRRSGIPDRWTATLLDQYGRIIARTVDPERTVGKTARSENWLRIQNAMSDTGTFDGLTQEGAPIHLAFTRSKNSGWTTVLSFPHALLASESGRSNLVLIATTVAILIAALILAWLIAHSISNAIRALIAPAVALGSGQAVSIVRTDLHEVNRVGEALVSAANMLQNARRDADEETARRVRAEDQLRQFEKYEALAELTGGLAHDFNNLLNIISTNAAVISLLPKGADLARPLAAVKRAVASGSGLIQQLLAFARKRPLTCARINVRKTLPMICDLARHSLPKTIQLKCEVAADVCDVMADAEELQLAIINMTINARDATPNGGVITIQARNVPPGTADAGEVPDPAQPYVAISIADTGTGIPVDVLPRIFEPFFTTKKEKGTGLGLSRVYGFVRQFGGSATAKNLSGGGALLTLYIPASDHPGEDSEKLEFRLAGVTSTRGS